MDNTDFGETCHVADNHAGSSSVCSSSAIRFGGLIIARQHPPTAKGFAFLAVEDPTGMVNVVLAPDVYAAYRPALQGAFVLIEGVVQKDHGAINVIARQVTNL